MNPFTFKVESIQKAGPVPVLTVVFTVEVPIEGTNKYLLVPMTNVIHGPKVGEFGREAIPVPESIDLNDNEQAEAWEKHLQKCDAGLVPLDLDDPIAITAYLRAMGQKAYGRATLRPAPDLTSAPHVFEHEEELMGMHPEPLSPLAGLEG